MKDRRTPRRVRVYVALDGIVATRTSTSQSPRLRQSAPAQANCDSGSTSYDIVIWYSAQPTSNHHGFLRSEKMSAEVAELVRRPTRIASGTTVTHQLSSLDNDNDDIISLYRSRAGRISPIRQRMRPRPSQLFALRSHSPRHRPMWSVFPS